MVPMSTGTPPVPLPLPSVASRTTQYPSPPKALSLPECSTTCIFQVLLLSKAFLASPNNAVEDGYFFIIPHFRPQRRANFNAPSCSKCLGNLLQLLWRTFEHEIVSMSHTRDVVRLPVEATRRSDPGRNPMCFNCLVYSPRHPCDAGRIPYNQYWSLPHTPGFPHSGGKSTYSFVSPPTGS